MRLAARLMAIFFTASLLLPALIAGPVSAAAADHFSVIVSPGSGTAGDAFNVTVTALDSGDAVDDTYVGEVHFTSSDTGGSTVLPGDYTFTGTGFDDGVHTFTGVILTTAGNRTITATDTATSSITGASTAVAISADVATQIDLTGATTSLAAGSGRTYTATIQDQYGNTVLSNNGTLISFAQTAGSGSVAGVGTDATANGVATKILTGHVVGSVTVMASASGLSDSNTRTFSVVPGAASQIDLTGGTSNLTAGTTRTLTATIKDAVGNVETGDNSTVVTFAKTGGAGTVTGLSTDMASSGVASVIVTGALIGSIDIHATAPSLTSNTLTFAVTIGSASQIDLTGSTGVLGSGSTRVLTATIKDAGGNTITSDSSTVSFDKTGGTGSVSGEGTAVAASGVATKTLTGDLVGSVSITATASGLSASSPLTFNVTVGPAAQIVLSGSAANLTSGTPRTLTATIEDAAGNILTADDSTVVAFAKTGGTGTVSGLGNATASNGVAQLIVTGGQIGSLDIEATAGVLTSDPLTFTVVVGAATQITLSGSIASVASGATRVLTATIKDAAGNTVTTDGSTIVSFDQTAGSGTVTGEGTDMASGGTASKTLTGLLIGSVTVTATASGLSASNTVTFTVVPGAATQIVLAASSANLTSGTTRVVTATLKDAAGNVETGDNATIVTFAKSGGAGTVSGLGTDTAALGVASITVTGVLAGSIDLEATGATLTSNTQTFTVTVGSASQIVLSGLSSSLSSGSTRLLTATIEDAAGNTRTADNTTTVTFSKTTGAGTVTGLGPDQVSGGVAQVTVTGVLAGSLTIHATGATFTSNTLTFTVVPGAATQIALTGLTTNLGSGSTRALTATLKDAAGNVESGDNTTVVTFGKTGGAGTVTGLGADAVALGVASLTVTGALAGSIDIEATASAITSNTLTFTVVFGPLDHILLSPPTATVDPAVARAYTVEAFDLAGNSRGDVTAAASLGIAGGGGSCDNILSTCRAAAVGAHTVTATYLTKTNTATLTINNLDPDAVDDTSISVNEDAVDYPINVLVNDSDANGDSFTITGVTQGSIGTVARTPDHLSVTYTPDAGNSGPDSFTYTIDDGNGGTDTATVTLTVVAINDAPSFTLGPDPSALEDAGLVTVPTFAVGNPGSSFESTQTLTYVVTGDTNPALFTALGEPTIDGTTGDLTFTPAADVSGTATITVHVVDSGPNGSGDVNFSPPQMFVVTVTAVDDSPVAVNDGTPLAYQVKQGVAATFPALTGVLANDTDIDSLHSALTAIVDTQPAPAAGTVTLNPDGSFTFTPNGVFSGLASFTYHAHEGTNDSNIATVSINVYINHAPTAVGDIVTVVSGSSYTSLAVLTNDNAVNPDPGEILHITHVSNPPHGSALITGGGTGLSYRPDSGFIGTDLFSYTISDGVFTSTATVLVHVPKDTYKPVATAPVQTIRGQTLGSTSVVVYLSWTGTDKGYGISKFEVWQSVNGHSYTKIKTTTGHSATVTAKVGTTYRFRVRAIDKKGNVGGYAYGPTFKTYLYQETSATYSTPWILANSSSYSGGHDRLTMNPGDSATFTSTGRTFAWVTAKGSMRSTADVYVDGVLKAHVNLAASSSLYKYVAYSITFAASGSHSLQVVYTGPAGTKRVDVDAFVLLR